MVGHYSLLALAAKCCKLINYNLINAHLWCLRWGKPGGNAGVDSLLTQQNANSLFPIENEFGFYGVKTDGHCNATRHSQASPVGVQEVLASKTSDASGALRLISERTRTRRKCCDLRPRSNWPCQRCTNLGIECKAITIACWYADRLARWSVAGNTPLRFRVST
jgi:hypothetical protein